MKKRIGNDITFTWHIYRKSGEEQVPESFTGKEVEVKLISPLQRPVTIEDVTIAIGVVTFTFRGKHQVTLGNYVAILQENRGEDGMVTLDVVDAVTLVPHSYMEEDGDEGDVIEAESVELESSIIAGGIVQQQADWAQTDDTAVDFIKNKPNLDVYCRKDADNTHSDSSDTYVKRVYYEQGALRQLDRLTVSGDSIKFYHSHRGEGTKELLLQLDDVEKIKRTATTELDGLMSAEDKGKLTALPTATELAQELGGKANSADLAEVATSGSYNDLSDKPDLSSFITRSVDNLVNYYLKSEIYTKTEVQQLIGAIQQFHYEVYPTLPQTGASNVLYLIGPTGSGSDKYEEYVYANNSWAKIGDTSIDLSGYVTTQALNTALADYVTSSALSTTLANYYNKTDVDGLLSDKANASDVYTKAETYNKTEVDNFLSQQYVSVTATAQTTAVTDLLPATGEAGTIYRVGNWDGTQYNDSVFSEYAWNGSAYIKLSTKSQVGEVYDISANHADTKYSDLAAALGANGDNIPQSLRKGGMSIKFVQTSDNKYVQCRCKAQSFSVNSEDWINVEDEVDIINKRVVSKAVTTDILRAGNYKANTGAEESSSTRFISDDANKLTIISDDADTVIALFAWSGNTYMGFYCSRPANSFSKSGVPYYFTKLSVLNFIIEHPEFESYTFKIIVRNTDNSIPADLTHITIYADNINQIQQDIEDLQDAQRIDIPADYLFTRGNYNASTGQYEDSSLRYVTPEFLDGTEVIVSSDDDTVAVLLAWSGSTYIGFWDTGGDFRKNRVPAYSTKIDVAEFVKLFPTYQFKCMLKNTDSSASANLSVVTVEKTYNGNIIEKNFERVGKEIDDIVDDVNELKNSNGILPDYWETYFNERISKLRNADASLGRNGVSFAFITDVHIDTNNKKSPLLLDYITKNTCVRKVVFGGDIITNYHTDKEDALDELYFWATKTSQLNIVNVYGNHDGNSNNQTDQTQIISEGEFYALECRQSESFVKYESGQLYGYEDNEDQKVRYIYLNTGAPDSAVIDQTQLTWMQQLISELQSGWTVIIFCHQFFTATSASRPLTIDGNGTAIMNAIHSIYSTIDATIACVIAGHCHRNYVYETEDGYPVITTTTDAGGRNSQYYDPDQPTRTAGTTSEQAFDLYYINTTNRTINIIRIGAGDTTLDREITY